MDPNTFQYIYLSIPLFLSIIYPSSNSDPLQLALWCSLSMVILYESVADLRIDFICYLVMFSFYLSVVTLMRVKLVV